METFRCPTCFFMLADPGVGRCPSCHKKLRRRGRPIVLGDKKHFGTHAPSDIDLLLAERAERAQASFNPDPLVASVPATAEVAAPEAEPLVVSPPWVSPPVYKAPVIDTPPAPAPPVVEAPPVVIAPPPAVVAPPVASESEPVQHTTIFEPSQFDPEMRQVLDSLYRKARSAPDERA